MIISYNWLNTYVDIKDLSPEKLSEHLTLAGLEVEVIEYFAQADNLVIGEIIEILDHPDADTLKITNVDIKDEVLQIVTGAPNIALNQKVIVAKVGANLNGFKIKKAKLRGVDSFGMLCSLNELGVDKKYLTQAQLDGIEILDDSATVGDTKVLEFLNLDDVLIEVDLTPNRNDALAMFNLAKEIGAILNREVKLPQINDNTSGLKTKLQVESKSKNSQQLVGQIVGEVSIKPSIPWMANVLRSMGMQPINNVVDISNIVMLETGQPLHFYDIEKLSKLELIVEDGYELEYRALDEEVYKVDKNDLVITNNNEVIGIAGIMGGENSKITDDTKSVLIEAAHFDYVTVRNSARDLNINSEASLRFSKGIDPNAVFYATDRAIDLLVKYADAKNVEERIVYGKRDLEKKEIKTTLKYINTRLGLDLTTSEVVDVFERLDFNPKVELDNIVVSIPTYRLDIFSEVDLSEEVIRLIGVDSIPSTLPKVEMIPPKVNNEFKIKEIIVSTLLGFGFSETVTYSLVSKDNLDLALMPIGKPVELSNPISNDRRYYRTSLFASMLDVIAYNEARSNEEYALYEIADVYSDDGSYHERLIVAQSSKTQISSWEKIIRVENFFSLKGRIEGMLKKIGINQERIHVEINKNMTRQFHPYQSANVYIDDKLFGILGKTHPSLEKEYDINSSLIGEFNLDVVYQAKKSEIKFKEIPKFPGISRDVALIVKEDLLSESLTSTILANGEDLVVSAEIFDVYQGANIEENHKSVAISIFYQSLDKTLTDEDINSLHHRIIDKLIEKHNVIYRK